MQQKNRKSLENELYIFQRDDVKSTDRWYCAFKLQGVPRIDRRQPLLPVDDNYFCRCGDLAQAFA